MLGSLVYLLVVLIVVGLVYWVIDAVGVPQPLNRFAKVAVIVIGVIAVIMILLGAVGVNVGLPAR
jgi:uncharacterized membrane protein